MSETSILDKLKDMVKLLENSLVDAEKLVSKGNNRSGIRVRKNMQDIRKKAKDVRNLVQLIKKDN